jgi:hypothetical protein
MSIDKYIGGFSIPYMMGGMRGAFYLQYFYLNVFLDLSVLLCGARLIPMETIDIA